MDAPINIITKRTKFTPEVVEYLKDMFQFVPPSVAQKPQEIKKQLVSTKVPYDKIWGRVDNSLKNYHRVDLTCCKEREHMQKIMYYSPGLFCVFTTSAKTITVKVNVHFHMDVYNSTMKSRVEPIVLGLDQYGVWNVLNNIRVFEKEVEKAIKSDQQLMFQVTNDQEYIEFQLCFPTMSIMNELVIETDEPIKFISPSECKVVFLGSSVSQDPFSSSHMNICPYLYRKFGVNASTLAVSGYHTFMCDELVDFLSNSEAQCVLMDALHIDNEVYTAASQKLKNLVPFIIFKDRKNVIDIMRSNHFGKNNLVILPGDCMYDSVHINDYGTVFYCNKLAQSGIIPEISYPYSDDGSSDEE